MVNQRWMAGLVMAASTVAGTAIAETSIPAEPLPEEMSLPGENAGDAGSQGDEAPGPGDSDAADALAEMSEADMAALQDAVAERLPAQTAPPPPIASILPSNTPAALLINTRAEAWGELDRYALFARLAASDRSLDPGLLPVLPAGLDYQLDVAPWVGDDVAIALLPIPSPRVVAPVERSVTVVPIADGAGFVPFIPRLAELRAAIPQETSYRQMPIWYWPAEVIPYEDPWGQPEVSPAPAVEIQSWLQRLLRSYYQPQPPYVYIPPAPGYDPNSYTIPGMAIAHVGSYAVMADSVDSLRQWIEYQQPAVPKLDTNPSFQQTQAHPQAASSLAVGYGSLGELLSFEFSNPFQGLGLPPIPQPSLGDRAAAAELLSQVSFDFLIYPEPQGLHLEAHFYSQGVLPPLPPSPNTDRSIFALMPAPTYALGSGYDIAGLWSDVSTAFSLSELTAGLLETLRSLVAFATGLDLDTDILSWMDGEYSVFFFPSQRGLFNSLLPGIGLEMGALLETSNRPAAETALSALDGIIEPEQLQTDAWGDRTVVSWGYDINGDSQPDSVVSHAWLTGDTLALTTGRGAMERLAGPLGFHPLRDHGTFRNATGSLPYPNNGYLYVNAGSTLGLLYELTGFNRASDPWSVSVRQYLGTLRSLSMTTATRPQEFQINALLGLAPQPQETAETLSPQEDGPSTNP